MASFDPFNPLKDVKINLTEEQVQEISDWFNENCKLSLVINDEPAIAAVTIEKIMKFLELKKYHIRSFQYPSYGDVMADAEKLKAGITRMITKDQLIYMLNKCTVLPDLKHEIKLAFKVFDTENRNFLDVYELEQIVTGYGDKFNESETLEMIRDANVRGDGNIFYDDFVESIFSLAPELYDEIKAEYLYENPDEDPSLLSNLPIEEPPPTKPDKKGKKKKGKK